jgi:5'-phosphate synthase pdxT subunit
VFIRAPQVIRVGDDVEVLARHQDRPVVVRQGALLAAAFHPEIAGDPRLHRRLLELAG